MNRDPKHEEALDREQLALLADDGGRRLRARVVSAAAAVGCIATLAAWGLELRKGDMDPFEAYGFPTIALLMAGLAVLHRSRLADWGEIALVLCGAGMLLERFHFTVHDPIPPLERVVNAYEVLAWFPAIYLFSFAVFRNTRALVFSFALLGTSLLLLTADGTSPVVQLERLDLLEIYIANAACIGFVFLLSALKERYLQTHDAALALQRFAETDYLTGIANRRRVVADLEQAIERSAKGGGPVSVILLDVDRFKGINDRFGHEAGDRVLQRVARVVEASLRTTDVLGRWGGEEFLILLPGLTVEHALEVAERVRGVLQAQAGLNIPHATASFGVATCCDGDDAGSLVRRADEALLEAKGAGRNRVVAST